MLTRSICLAALVLVACKEESAPAKPSAPAAPAKPAAPPPPPDAALPDAAPALPTDPKQLAELRNKAILDGRYDVALTICVAENPPALDEQSVMACVLAACQRSDVEKAQAWGKVLKGPLKAQAKKICLANKIPL